MVMARMFKLTRGGQVSLPAAVRRRWATRAVVVEDRGDHVVVRPSADDPITAARGALKPRQGSRPASGAEAVAESRRDEQRAERAAAKRAAPRAARR